MNAPAVIIAPQIGFRLEAAAAYVGMSASKFRALVADGRMPQGHRVDGMVIWRADELIRAFDALTGAPSTGLTNPAAEWDEYDGPG